MRLLAALCVLFIIGAYSDSDVLTLTSENFDTEIAANPLVLVEFYAPWCGHCKKLAPEWEKAATDIKEKGIIAKLAQVDADDQLNAELRSRFDIKGFPTIKLFRNGAPSEFSGERTADAIVGYLKKQASPASTSLTTVDEATKFSESDRIVIVGFFDSQDSPSYTVFKTVANVLRDSYSFGEVIGNAEVNKALEVEKTPSIVLFKQFDEKRVNFENIETGDLTEFIRGNSVPSIDEIGPHNFKTYLESGMPLAYLFVDLAKEGKDALVEDFKELIQATKGKLNWVYIDWSKYAKHAERLGLSGKTVPAIAIEKMEEGIHFAYDELATFAKEGVTAWVNKFISGELVPTIKSEAIPETNDGPVKIVVANNFDQIVNDSEKDVLVEFYAPWCGHCKKLAPIFDELGTTLASSPNVVVAKIDATANDVSPQLNIRGFPTIKLFPAKNKGKPIDYEGDRSLEDMIKFMETNAGVSVKADLNKEEL